MSTGPAPRVSPDRLVGICVRTAHLLATSAYVGGLFADAPDSRQRRWRQLTLLTGLALLAHEAHHSRDWPRQGRGLAAYAHVGVLAVAPLSPAAAKGASAAALIIGSVGSHLPRSVRTWTLDWSRAAAD